MKLLTTAVLVILTVTLLLHDVDARGGRGGGGRGGGSRGGRGSRGGSRSSGSSKSRITKTTSIKPVRFRTPVIKSQAIRGSRTKLFTRVAAGYLVTRYILARAPVYREGFPVYGRYVSIPEERAVRLSSERVSLLDSNGNLCLTLRNSSIPRTLKDGIEKNLFELNTTVIYKTNPGKVTIIVKVKYGVDNTVSLEDIKDRNFTVTTRARYNVTVVENTNCTQVEKQINGTMIDLYEFNPNAENNPNTENKEAGISVAYIIIIVVIAVIIVVVGGVRLYMSCS